MLWLPSRVDWTASYAAAGWSLGLHEDMHAGALERSLLLYLAPEKFQPILPADVDVSGRPYFTATGLGTR
ncbi:MAG: hypothetical protein C7B46_18610 [Sulfobacillus benefaciens]|uniref:Uncharacterized protein n=1 Tax=Sulfobacillus benefaciens TaxID=453960 RepID=A0A2T2X549_9FIRM|nr:MAG: hypothetical protein C7B46_18610 [Sulfobacillus benefaciens]